MQHQLLQTQLVIRKINHLRKPLSLNRRIQTECYLKRPKRIWNATGSRRKTEDSVGESCVEDINAASTTASTTQAAREVATTAASVASNVAASNGGARTTTKKVTKVTNNEKTLLLSSDDEFQ